MIISRKEYNKRMLEAEIRGESRTIAKHKLQAPPDYTQWADSLRGSLMNQRQQLYPERSTDISIWEKAFKEDN